tara:strand:- start:542 stop:820 length:279 start_codon:yes stop_codon:yes gene_type:complete
MNNKNFINRRNFIKYSILASASILIINSVDNKKSSKRLYKKLSLKNQLKIESYNSKRKDKLKNDLSREIYEDHYNEATIWIGKNLYTYAELY